MNIPFFRPFYSEELNNEISKVITSGYWTGGSEVESVEELITKEFLFPNFTCTSSGTGALELAIDVLVEKKNSNVVVPVNTFTTTAEVPKRLGHNVIFCDVDADSGMLDFDHFNEILTKNIVDVVIPVSIGGYLYGREKLLQLKSKYGFLIIEDLAQLIYPSCFHLDVDASFFSFYPNKILSTPDGGGVVYSDRSHVEKSRLLRLHGIKKKEVGGYDVTSLGRKVNMTNMTAAILKDQVSLLNEKIDRRIHVYKKYIECLNLDVVRVKPLTSDMIPSLFNVHVQNRDALQSYLLENGVQTSIHFKPLHLHSLWSDGDSYLGAESYYETALSLPFYELLEDKEVEYISKLINRFYSK